MTYRPELDGLRGIAALLVVLFHCRVPGFGGGFLGVDVFFVLSGFLITSLLLAEHSRTGSIALGRFYWRRALRLYPPLLLLLAAYLALAPLAWPGHQHGRDALLAGLYLSDYVRTDYLLHTWSLAVEEQFYLLFPVVLLVLLRNPERLARNLALAAVGAAVWRALCADSGHGFYFTLDTRLAGLFAGAALAAARLPAAPRWVAWSGVGVLAYAAFTATEPLRASTGLHTLPLAEVAAVGIVWGAAHLPLRGERLVWLGRLSYGIYLWHYPLARLTRETLDWWVAAPLVLIASVALAAISYWTVEVYFRSRHRHRAELAGDAELAKVEIAAPVR